MIFQQEYDGSKFHFYTRCNEGYFDNDDNDADMGEVWVDIIAGRGYRDYYITRIKTPSNMTAMKRACRNWLRRTLPNLR